MKQISKSVTTHEQLSIVCDFLQTLFSKHTYIYGISIKHMYGSTHVSVRVCIYVVIFHHVTQAAIKVILCKDKACTPP